MTGRRFRTVFLDQDSPMDQSVGDRINWR